MFPVINQFGLNSGFVPKLMNGFDTNTARACICFGNFTYRDLNGYRNNIFNSRIDICKCWTIDAEKARPFR